MLLQSLYLKVFKTETSDERLFAVDETTIIFSDGVQQRQTVDIDETDNIFYPNGTFEFVVKPMNKVNCTKEEYDKICLEYREEWFKFRRHLVLPTSQEKLNGLYNRQKVIRNTVLKDFTSKGKSIKGFFENLYLLSKQEHIENDPLIPYGYTIQEYFEHDKLVAINREFAKFENDKFNQKWADSGIIFFL